MKNYAFVTVAALLASACGATASDTAGEEPEKVSSRDDGSGAAAIPNSGASIEAQASVNCSQVKGQTAPEGQPTDDVLGVRPGMEMQQVRAILECQNPDMVFNEQEQDVIIYGKTSEGTQTREQVPAKVLSASSGLDHFNLRFIGSDGHAKLVGIQRRVDFGEEEKTSVTRIVDQLKQKYGEFDSNESLDVSLRGRIVRSRSGERMTAENDFYSTCGSTGWLFNREPVPPCGLLVAYQVQSRAPKEAKGFTVDVIDHAKAVRLAQVALEQERSQRAAEEKQLENSKLSIPM